MENEREILFNQPNGYTSLQRNVSSFICLGICFAFGLLPNVLLVLLSVKAFDQAILLVVDFFLAFILMVAMSNYIYRLMGIWLIVEFLNRVASLLALAHMLHTNVDSQECSINTLMFALLPTYFVFWTVWGLTLIHYFFLKSISSDIDNNNIVLIQV